ncbi:hypothetical protein HK096_008561 [Nowakowskiella sp. JEL0078]|nr:hypothetical protein HK096_008561 [Nowakowskiella sp. JEL0078]
METITGLKTCCVSGYLEKGVTEGEEIKLGKINSYVSRAKSDKTPTSTAIVLIHDAFGWTLNNSRLVADIYAKETGFDTYVPDFHNGSSMSQSILEVFLKQKTWTQRLSTYFSFIIGLPSIIGWLSLHGDKQTLPLVDKVIDELRNSIGVQKIGVAGFCWGGRYAILLGGGEPKVDAVVAFHPSFVNYDVDLIDIKVPVVFNLAEHDTYFTHKRINQTREIMTKKENAEVIVYVGMTHGWSLRGNTELPAVREARDKSHETTISFFKTNL